ncbi:TVP38/TMEM64 family protein [Paenibacillus alginolyticus]|uniref:TVP38/TMEM64 family membrane protein n=1 Tax=Paenibacillus alginolyticus TaxID=59839 RepID=A0ABT4GDD5_9BACL|nr:TVP38/TMEM64 family protein [Paenibacillus alginolyticus]MCY9694205.1 TVP38/TMEM64 family protein [Paenibacillus alginolyticus]MEC0142755.1 TVP38/TMEM64 family protein [Paenibacillus alginolyticus]
MMKKWLLFFGYVIAVIAIILYKDPILGWLHDDTADHFMLPFGAAVLIALIPVVPYGVIAGIIGGKYGPFLGGMINVLSSTVAAALLFLLVRVVFQEQGIRFLAKFKRIDQFTTLMERNAFFAVLLARLIPFVPAAFVNVYTAISRMRFSPFVAATLLGKIPMMFVFALIGDQLLSDLGNVLWISLIYMGFLLLVFLVYRWLRKRKISNAG